MSYQDTKSFEQELNDCRDASIELLKYCTELRELNAELVEALQLCHRTLIGKVKPGCVALVISAAALAKAEQLK